MPCFFFALKYLPMSKGAIILGIAPLIVSVVAYFLLNEVLHPREIVCLIGAFIGMFIVNATKAENKHANTYDDMYTTGVWLWFFALIFRSSAPISMRYMNKYWTHIYSPFYFSFGMFLAASIIMLFFRSWLNYEYYTISDITLFVISSIFNYAAQTTMSLAFWYEKATVLAPFSYINVSMLLLIDLFLLKYEFKMSYFIGFILILCWVLYPLVIKLYMK